MPTYQYACTDCGDRSEVVQRFTDDPLTVCAACGGKLRKVFSPVGIVFKGSGFYRTDSRNGGSAASAGKESAAKDSAGKESAAKESAASGSNGASSDTGSSSSSSSSSDSSGSSTSSGSSSSAAKKSSAAASAAK